jgi:hypothetical protein
MKKYIFFLLALCSVLPTWGQSPAALTINNSTGAIINTQPNPLIIHVASGQSLVIDSGASIFNNGTATGFGGGGGTVTSITITPGSGLTGGGTITTNGVIPIGLGTVLTQVNAGTWAGSTSITTVGTITTGLWQSTIIAPAYLGSGSPTSSTVLYGNGVWDVLPAGVSSISNSDGTLIISQSTGPVVVSLNPANTNTWTGVQTLDSPVLITPSLGNATATTINNIGIAYSGLSQVQFTNNLGNTILFPSGTHTLLATNGSAASLTNFPNAGIVTALTGGSGTLNLSGYTLSLASGQIPNNAANTSGSAASLSISGQTGLLTIAGLTSTNRIKTVLDTSDTLLELAGSYSPTGTWTSLTMVTPVLGTPASGNLANCTFPTLNQNTTGSSGSVGTGTYVPYLTGGVPSAATPAEMASALNTGTLTSTLTVQGTFAQGGTLGFSDTGIGIQSVGTTNSYYQNIIQNLSTGTAASSDLILCNNNSTATTYYGDLGINGGNFSGTGSLAIANATYLYSQTGDLVLGTNTANNIHFVTDNGAQDALYIPYVASAVNGETLTQGATGVAASFTATGSDSNIGNGLFQKGSGTINIGTSSATSANLTSIDVNVGNGNNYQFSGTYYWGWQYYSSGAWAAIGGTTVGRSGLVINETGNLIQSSGDFIGFSSSGVAITADTSLSRASAGVIAFGTGTAGSTAGSWSATSGTLTGTLTLSTSLTGVLKATSGVVSTATSGTDFSFITVQTGTLVGGTATKTVPAGCHPWVQDTASSLTNVGSLVVTVSGTTATITSTNVLDTSPFTLYNAGSQ